MSEPDEAGFESFVVAAWPRLRQAAYALTRDTDDAEDLLQGVLVAAVVATARRGRRRRLARARAWRPR